MRAAPSRPALKTLAALATLTLCSSLQAAVLTFEYGLPLVESPAEINQSGSLGLFDTQLGTLTGLSLTLLGSATFEFSVINNSVKAHAASVTSGTTLGWSSSVAALSDLLAPASLALSYGIGPTVFAAGSAQSFGPVQQTGSVQLDEAALAGLGGQLSAAGGGSFMLSCQSVSALLVQGGGALQVPASTQAGCGARISYRYQPAGTPPPGVPEPGSLALAGAALALALASGTRGRRKTLHA